MFYFLEADFSALNAEIEKAKRKVKEFGAEMGLSCQEGAETFHDNFAYEDGERQQKMWARRLRDLAHIRDQARIARPQKGERAAIGKTVSIRDTETDETRNVTIGSYMILTEPNDETISYNAPLARIIIGGIVGETREGIISGKKKAFLIQSIT